MSKRFVSSVLLLSLALLTACNKSEPEAGSNVASSLSSTMSNAAQKAREGITSSNLTVGSLHGSAKAEITPQGDFLIDSKPVAITPEQRQLLMNHRKILTEVAVAGVEIGIQGVDLAKKAAGDAIKSIFSGDSKELEKKVETEAKKIEESAEGLCKQLPLLMESQQKLAASLPEFKPYATMTADDIDDCHGKVIERK